MQLLDEPRLRSRRVSMIACLLCFQLAAYGLIVALVATLKLLSVTVAGIIVGQCCLLSAVAAMGPWRLLPRLMITGGLTVGGLLGLAIAERPFGFSAEEAVLMCLFALAFWGLIQIPLWLARLALGVSMIRGEDSTASQATRSQYGIRQLMVLTFGVCLILGIGRWVTPAKTVEDLNSVSIGDWILFGTMATALSLLAATSIIGTLHVHYWRAGIAVSAASAGLVAIGDYSVSAQLTSLGKGEAVLHSLMIVSAYLWLLLSVLLVRVAGYRIIVRS